MHDKQLILIDTQIGQYRRVNTDTVKIDTQIGQYRRVNTDTVKIDTQIGQYRRVNTDTVKIVKTKSLDLKIKRPLYKI